MFLVKTVSLVPQHCNTSTKHGLQYRYLKGNGNEADFLGFLQKLVPHRSLTGSHYLSSRSDFGFEFAEIFVIEKRWSWWYFRPCLLGMGPCPPASLFQSNAIVQHSRKYFKLMLSMRLEVFRACCILHKIQIHEYEAQTWSKLMLFPSSLVTHSGFNCVKKNSATNISCLGPLYYVTV